MHGATRCEICHRSLPSSSEVEDYERNDLCVDCEMKDILRAYTRSFGDLARGSALFECDWQLRRVRGREWAFTLMETLLMWLVISFLFYFPR